MTTEAKNVAVVHSKKSSGFRLEVQGIRAIAVFLVVAVHSGLPVPGGFVGVDVFFVVSGYVITRLLLATAASSGSFELRTFYKRRIMRLMAPLAIVMSLTLLVSIFFLSPWGPQRVAASTGIASSLLISNLYLGATTGGYFDQANTLNPLLHIWSLSVEEQFYIFFPLALSVGYLALRRVAARTSIRRVTFWMVLLITAISLAICARYTPSRGILAYYATPFRAWEFGVGALLVFFESSKLSRKASDFRLGAGASCLGLAAVLYAAFAFDARTTFPGTAALLPVLGAALLIWGSGVSATPRGVLSLRPLVWVGDISYSFYLLHWPVIVFALVLDTPRALVVVLAFSTMLPAWWMRRIETPLRKLGRLPKSKAWITVAVLGISVPIAIALCVLLGSRDHWGLAAPPGLNDVPQCPAGATTSIAGSAVCQVRTTTADAMPSGIVLVLGDSHAESVQPGVIDTASKDGYDVVISSSTGCPFLPTPVAIFGGSRCVGRYAAGLELIKQLKPTVVVVSNHSYRYIPVGNLQAPGWEPDNAAFASVPTSVALGEYQTAFASMLTDVTRLGSKVVVIQTWEDFGFRFPSQGPSLVRPHVIPPVLPLASVDPRMPLVMSIESSESDGVAGVALVDTLRVLCDSQCEAYRDGNWLYFDAQHLTNHGSRLLSPAVETALREVRMPR